MIQPQQSTVRIFSWFCKLSNCLKRDSESSWFFKPSFWWFGSRTDGLQSVLASIQKIRRQARSHSSCWGRFHAVVFITSAMLTILSLRKSEWFTIPDFSLLSFRRRNPSRIPPTHRCLGPRQLTRPLPTSPSVSYSTPTYGSLVAALSGFLYTHLWPHISATKHFFQ